MGNVHGKEIMQIADNLQSGCYHLRNGNRRCWSAVIALLISLFILVQMFPAALATGDDLQENQTTVEDQNLPSNEGKPPEEAARSEEQ